MFLHKYYEIALSFSPFWAVEILHYCSDSFNFTMVQFQVEKEGLNIHGNVSQEQKHHACV